MRQLSGQGGPVFFRRPCLKPTRWMPSLASGLHKGQNRSVLRLICYFRGLIMSKGGGLVGVYCKVSWCRGYDNMVLIAGCSATSAVSESALLWASLYLLLLPASMLSSSSSSSPSSSVGLSLSLFFVVVVVVVVDRWLLDFSC